MKPTFPSWHNWTVLWQVYHHNLSIRFGCVTIFSVARNMFVPFSDNMLITIVLCAQIEKMLWQKQVNSHIIWWCGFNTKYAMFLKCLGYSPWVKLLLCKIKEVPFFPCSKLDSYPEQFWWTATAEYGIHQTEGWKTWGPWKAKKSLAAVYIDAHEPLPSSWWKDSYTTMVHHVDDCFPSSWYREWAATVTRSG